jgi:hypothetical protein
MFIVGGFILPFKKYRQLSLKNNIKVVMFLDYDVICYIDGASRGNPGLSGIGFVVNELKNNNNLFKFSKFIGKTTNNVAEYTALIYALEYLQKKAAST